MPSAADFEHLSVAEKIQLVTQLWDQIASSDQPIALPAATLAVAEQRLDEMISEPTPGITEDEMWRQADALRK
jgi:putative addiction module component (TIGR02574 family)